MTRKESGLHLSYAPDTKKPVADDQLVDKTNVTDPDCGAKVETIEPTKTVICEPRRSERPAVGDDCARGSPSSSSSK